jgi:hypothetical protein
MYSLVAAVIGVAGVALKQQRARNSPPTNGITRQEWEHATGMLKELASDVSHTRIESKEYRGELSGSITRVEQKVDTLTGIVTDVRIKLSNHDARLAGLEVRLEER